MLVDNPIVESHMVIIKHDIVAELLGALRNARKELGENTLQLKRLLIVKRMHRANQCHSSGRDGF